MWEKKKIINREACCRDQAIVNPVFELTEKLERKNHFYFEKALFSRACLSSTILYQVTNSVYFSVLFCNLFFSSIWKFLSYFFVITSPFLSSPTFKNFSFLLNQKGYHSVGILLNYQFVPLRKSIFSIELYAWTQWRNFNARSTAKLETLVSSWRYLLW